MSKGHNRRHSSCATCRSHDCDCDDTGRCDVRKQEYFLPACPQNRDHRGPLLPAGVHPAPGTELDDVKVFVQDYGPIDAPVIVFQGGTFDPQSFEYQFTPIVNAGFRVIAITPRGMGTSDKPFEPYGLDVWADDLAAVIDQLDIGCFTLVGSTPQSRIALRYLTRHGCRQGVSRVFFHAPSAVPIPPAIADGLRAGFQVNREDTINGVTFTVFFPIIISPTQTTWANQQQFQIPIRVWLDFVDAVATDMTAELQNVCAPMLAIVGDGDLFSPLPVVQAYVAGVPNGALVVVPGQGHGVQISDPNSYNEALIAFARAANPCAYVRSIAAAPPPPPPAPVVADAPSTFAASAVPSGTPRWTGWQDHRPVIENG